MSVLAVLKQGVKQAFYDTYDNVSRDYQQVASLTTSSGRTESYAFLDNLPLPSKFKGQTLVRLLDATPYVVENILWQDAVRLYDRDIRDDQTGSFITQVRAMGNGFGIVLNQEVFNILDQGHTSKVKAYDGSPLIRTSNTVTGALSSAKFDEAVKTLINAPDSNGKKGIINRSLDLVWVVPAGQRAKANEIVKAQLTGGGNTNTNYGQAEVIVSPDLTSDVASYLVNRGAIIRPIILQTREEVSLNDYRDDDTLSQVFSATWDGATKAGLPQAVVKLSGA